MPRNYFLIGPPNSNKTTISESLSLEFNLVHIPLQKTLQDEISNQSGFGVESKKYFDSETPVPDDLIFDVLLSKLKPIKFENFIISGFPVTLSQARVIEFYLRKNNIPISAVIFTSSDKDFDLISKFFIKKNIKIINSELENIISQLKS